jgi:electron transport complex protein RnfB
MSELVGILGVLGLLGAVLGTGLAWADRRLRPDTDSVADAIDALLPQTQCAQCGYPGCRPYAEAVAAGAPIDLCPPGGQETIRSLGALLGRKPASAGVGQVESSAGLNTRALPAKALLARIDESRCIGCYRCIQACPVDAIVGAAQLMHTVLADRCTGCELCLDPCPVDCIELVSKPAQDDERPLRIIARPRNRDPQSAELPCIRCGKCEVACPEVLIPQELLWYARDAAWDEARDHGLDDCIECGLCNQVCPSNIDLLRHFSRGRLAVKAQEENRAEAQAAKARFDKHQARMLAREAELESRRRHRLDESGDRPWLR